MGNPPFRASRKHRGPKRVHDRRVMDGILFVLRTGTPWRDLPERCGPCTTCFNRYNRRAGTASGRRSWRNFRSLRKATTTTAAAGSFACAWRVPRRSASAGTARAPRGTASLPRSGLAAAAGPRRSATGIDGNELVKAVLPTPGQAADCTQAGALLEGLGPDETMIGDRDCDGNAILDMISAAGATAVIPPKSSRNEQRGLDREACRERSPVERFIGRIKEFRRVAARHDRTARNFLSTVRLAISRFLLRRVASRLIESAAWSSVTVVAIKATDDTSRRRLDERQGGGSGAERRGSGRFSRRMSESTRRRGRCPTAAGSSCSAPRGSGAGRSRSVPGCTGTRSESGAGGSPRGASRASRTSAGPAGPAP